MRIGFLINTCEPFYRGGYERRVYDFARVLVKRGHQVRVYTSCDEPVELEGVCFVPLAPQRRYFNARGVRNIWADVFFALTSWRLLFVRERLDVLDVCATPFLHVPVLRIISALRRWPMVLTCHEALLHAIPEYVRERGNQHAISRALLASVLRATYCIALWSCRKRIAVSKTTALGLEEEGLPAAATVGNGLPIPELPPPVAQRLHEGVRLISVGRLTPIKSVHIILEGLANLDASWHLDVVGTGSERERLEGLSEKLGIADRLSFHGTVEDARRDALLLQADVFLLASPREGFCLAAMEALASGCILVAASKPPPDRPSAVTDYLKDGFNGLIFDGTPGSLTDALKKLLRKPTSWDEMKQAAHQTAREYDLETQTSRLEKAYEMLAQSS